MAVGVDVAGQHQPPGHVDDLGLRSGDADSIRQDDAVTNRHIRRPVGSAGTPAAVYVGGGGTRQLMVSEVLFDASTE